MTRLGILYGRARGAHLYASGTLTPLLRWRRPLRDGGMELVFATGPGPAILGCEAVIVIDFFDNPLAPEGRSLETLAELRKRGARLLYFDNSDSCGTTQFEVLEYFDRYLKKQLYRDRSLYTRDVYGLRSYCEFYHERFGTADTVQEHRQSIAPQSLGKLCLAWNSGLGPHALRNRFFRKANMVNFSLGLPVRFQFTRDVRERLAGPRAPLAWSRRSCDIHYRAYINYVLETIAFGRNRVNEVLDTLAGRFSMRYRGIVSRTAYLREMERSKAILSPFGYGEICRRDFEAFLCGGVLVKPDMGHVETWPDYYEPGATYAPYRWDFSDLPEVLERVVGSTDSAALAHAARQRYMATLSGEGGERFCRRLKELCGL